MNYTPLKLLLVEDSEDDAELLLYELRRVDYDLYHVRVETREEMHHALRTQDWDIVISDYSMPRFSGEAALQLLQELEMEIPFIIVSGAIGEERAVEIMRAGASDYVMKGNLKRLIPAVQRELREAAERKLAQDAVRQSEARLRALLDATTDVAFLTTVDGTFLTLNKTLADSRGKSVEELIGESAFDSMSQALRDERLAYFEKVRETGQPIRWQDVNATSSWDNSIYPIFSHSGSVEAFAVYGRDITLQKELENELQRYNSQLERMVEERTGELRRAKEQIELILNNTRDAIALAQPNGDIREKNPAFLMLFGEEATHNIERILWSLLDESHISSVGSALINVIFDKEHQRLETQINNNTSNVHDIDLALIPVELENPGEENRLGILISAHDITPMKEIERFKARFVADAVHDLATPISGLSTRLYLLERTPERLTEHLRALKNQVEHLRDLLGDLRTLSQLDRGQLALELDYCSLNHLILRVFDTYEPVAIGKQQTLNLQIDPAVPKIRMDSRRIERVLVNLIANAINYTPSGKKIDIETRFDGEHVVFSVTDEGIGISEEELTQVFERFYRTERARSTQSGGTGLGLAISREIVEIHRGTISVMSKVNQGSTFMVMLPAT